MPSEPNPITAGLVSVGRGDTSYRCLALIYETITAARAAHAAIITTQTSGPTGTTRYNHGPAGFDVARGGRRRR